MDHVITGGVVSDGYVDCGHNSCDFDILSHNFEVRYKLADHLGLPIIMH